MRSSGYCLRACQGTALQHGMHGGTRASRVLWGHLPQASAGFRGLWAPGFSRLVGTVCVCVHARERVCLLRVLRIRPAYLPGGARVLPAPLGSFLSRKWDCGVTSARPCCPCHRGPCCQRGLGCVSRKVALCPLRKLGRCWAGLRVGFRGGRTLQPLVQRPEGAGTQ